MSALVWHAVREMAKAWRSSTYVQDYLVGAREPLGMCSSSGHHIAAQPFFMWRYLPTHMGFDEFARTADANAWLEKGANLEHAYTTLIEWLRSRLDGYPFLGAPQLADSSPWTSFNVSMHVPWLVELREWRLHTKATPPTIPFLEVDAATQLAAGTRLGTAVASSLVATDTAAAWQALTERDKDQLRAASEAVQQARYLEPADVTGAEDFRHLGWAETTLDQATDALTGQARWFAETLGNADRLIQQAAALFSQLVVYDHIRQLRNVTLVEQFDGAGGWHSVRSDSYLIDHVRQFEIIGFDHPYPRGVMLARAFR